MPEPICKVMFPVQAAAEVSATRLPQGSHVQAMPGFAWHHRLNPRGPALRHMQMHL